MYKTKYLREFMQGPVFNYLKKTNVSPEFLTLFRIIFAFITGIILFFGNYWLSLIFLTLAQFVFMIDYVDGPLARYRKRFSTVWQKADRVMHYVISALFLFAITISYFIKTENYVMLTVGIIGFLAIIYTLLLNILWYGKLGFPLTQEDKEKSKRENTGILTKFYSFLGIDIPFSLFFIFFIFNLISISIVFFSLLKTVIFINKIFYLRKWQKPKKR